MADFYITVTSTRTTPPDPVALLATLRGADATVGISADPIGQTFKLKKSTTWTPPQIAGAQNAIDSAPALTPQRQAQNEIDAWPITQKAFALALIDQLNVIRSKLSPPLPDITSAQALAAIRAKAGTL